MEQVPAPRCRTVDRCRRGGSSPLGARPRRADRPEVTKDGDPRADVALVLRSGSEAAFGQLVEAHRRELRVHCYRMLGSFHEAEDLVQETFLPAWRRRETFQGRSTLRTGLYRIAKNGCLELLRRDRRPVPATGADGQVPPYSAMPWLQPFPHELIDAPAPTEDEPETVAVAREPSPWPSSPRSSPSPLASARCYCCATCSPSLPRRPPRCSR